METGYISKITLPDNSTYSIKDSDARESVSRKIFIDDRISGIQGYSDLSVIKLSAFEYDQLVADDQTLSNNLYIIEDEFEDAYGQQIKNLAPGTDLSDAVNLEQLSNALSDVQIPTDLSAFSNSPGYTTNIGTITGITMNGASKGTSGVVNLGTVLTAHQSLANYYTKSDTSSAIEIQSALNEKQPAGEYALVNQIPLSVSQLDNDAGYLTAHQSLSDYYQKSETSSASEIQSALDEKQPSGEYALTSQIPTNVSQLSNDAGYLTEHQSLSDYYMKNETSSANQISDELASKLESTAAAPVFDSSKTYDVGEYVTHDSMLYVCTSAVETSGEWTGDSNWLETDMTTPDATLDIMANGQLRLMSAGGEVLWMQGYKLAETSSITLSCDSVNYYAFAADELSMSFDMPSAPVESVGDFILDIDNTANVSSSASITLNGIGSLFDVFVPTGQNVVTDILTFDGNETCELYFTMTAFGTAAKPAWKVVKQVVEKQEFGS